MSGRFIKFPKIVQLRNVVSDWSYRAHKNDEFPTTIKFHGSVKLHGTNAAVALHPDGSIRLQSRNRTLNVENDNAGFAKFASEIGEDKWRNILTELMGEHPGKSLVLYGEWAGEGIQKDVAISNVEKAFFPFAMRVEDIEKEESTWLDLKSKGNLGLDDLRIFSVCDPRFPTWEIDIDLHNLADAADAMIKIKDEVEKECPIGKFFGHSGIGEGVVWHPDYNSPLSRGDFSFKVKGEKHSASKVKTMDPEKVAFYQKVAELADNIVTDRRLEQGIEYLKEMGLPLDQRSFPDYIRWVINDVWSEEADIIEASGIEAKPLNKRISGEAGKFFKAFLNRDALDK